jgi:hypothetical protein
MGRYDATYKGSPNGIASMEARFRSAFLFIVSFFNITGQSEVGNGITNIEFDRYELLTHLSNIYPAFVDLTPVSA